jgi:molybdate transport system substrate-binding protein
MPMAGEECDKVAAEGRAGRAIPDPVYENQPHGSGEDVMAASSNVAAACSVLALIGLCAFSAPAAVAADLIVLTDQGSVPNVRELAGAFARASGHTVSVLQETGAAVERRINEGPADLITGNPERIADLVKTGKIVAGTDTPFALASLGVSVRAGAPKPDIGTVDAYKAALLAARSIGYSYGCSGTHVAQGIEKLGLTDALKGKTVRSGGAGGPVTDYVARGDVEIGIQQTNIMIGVPGTDYVGVPPGFLNDPCQSDVAVMMVSKQPEAARAMIAFMVSPEAVPLLRKTYVEPPKN